MLSMHTAAMDVVETISGSALEMMGFVAVKAMIAAAIPEETVIAPIAIVKGAVRAVIITVIIIRSAGDGDIAADRDTGLATGKQRQRRQGQKGFAHDGRSLVQTPLPGT